MPDKNNSDIPDRLNNMLQQWNQFISGRIAATLGQGETGLIFLGAYHDILSKLPKDIHDSIFHATVAIFGLFKGNE